MFEMVVCKLCGMDKTQTGLEIVIEVCKLCDKEGCYSCIQKHLEDHNLNVGQLIAALKKLPKEFIVCMDDCEWGAMNVNTVWVDEDCQAILGHTGGREFSLDSCSPVNRPRYLVCRPSEKEACVAVLNAGMENDDE